MKSKHLLFCCLAFVQILVGCAVTRGVKYDFTSILKISVGTTTKSQVEQLLGKPLRTSTQKGDISESTIYCYGYFSFPPRISNINRNSEKNLNIEFVRDTVNAYYSSNSFEENSSDFNAELRNQIITDKSSKQDVIALLGQPTGIFNLPSQMLANMAEQWRKTQCTGAKQCWNYFYTYNFVKNKLEYTYTKWLLIYFDKRGIALDNIYFENSK